MAERQRRVATVRADEKTRDDDLRLDTLSINLKLPNNISASGLFDETV